MTGLLRAAGRQKALPYRRLWPASLLVILPMIACRKIILYTLLGRPDSCAAFNHLIVSQTRTTTYNQGVLAINYGEHGFIRRGLVGTLLKALRSSPFELCNELVLFHLLSALWLAVPLMLLVRRVAASDQRYAALLVILLVGSPQLFWAWGGDIGRTDMFTSGFVAWAIIAMLSRRHLLAVLALLIGMLAHESAAIYGAPLLASIFLARTDADAPRQAWLSAVVLVAGLVAIALGQRYLVSAGPSDIIAAILRSEPPSDMRDLAAYMTADGSRSIVTSWCMSLGRAATPLYLACMVLLVPIYGWLLRVRREDAGRYLLATALPLAAITFIAMDYGRWVIFATLNAWLFAAASAITSPIPRRTKVSDATRLAVLAVLFAMRPTLTLAPNLFVVRVAEQIWGEQGALLKDIDSCDPAWRTSLGLPAHPNYSFTPKPPAGSGR